MSGSRGDESRVEDAERYHHARPGEGARTMASELAAGKSKLRQLAERALDVPTEERNWRKGAKGEEVVGRRLDRLRPHGWAVVHDLTIGSRGANLDHLVIGPAGVFTLNTKYLSGKITVYERAMLVDGHKTPYLPKAVREAERVQAALTRVVGRPVHAWALIVLVGPQGLTIKQRPDDVSVLRDREVPDWFLRLPAAGLSPREVIELETVARAASTWPSKPAPTTDTTAARPVITQPPPPTGPRKDLPLPVVASAIGNVPPPPSGDQQLVLQPWRRFGHDRIYVNTPSGETLGYLDVGTDLIHVENPRDRDRVAAALDRPAQPGAPT